MITTNKKQGVHMRPAFVLKMKKPFIIFFAALLFVSACKKQDSAGQQITFSNPSNFPPPKYNFANNAVTTQGFELRRKLCFDVSLSRDNSTSCGTCHSSFSAITHHGHPVSHGINNKLGRKDKNINPMYPTSATRCHTPKSIF